MICFFIVNKAHEQTFIEKTALEFIDQGTYYHFYGKYEPVWHLAFDETDTMLYPNSTVGTVAMTCGYDDLEEFAEEIYTALDSKYFVSTDVFIFYDDAVVYQKVKEFIASMRI